MGDVEAPIKITMRVLVQVEVNGVLVEGWLPTQNFHSQKADRLVDPELCEGFVRNAVIRAIAPDRSTEGIVEGIARACRRPLGLARRIQ